MGVAAVAHDFAVAEGEEVGAGVPLLAQLVPGVAAAADDGLDVPAQRLEAADDVGILLVAYLAALDGDEGGVLAGEEAGLLEHGLEGHALVPAEEGEDHVEVDEALGALRQFLDQDVHRLARLRAPGSELRAQVFDAFGVGADALADAEEVGRGDLHVAAFGACVAVPLHGVEGVDVEEVAEDGLVDEGFALAHLETHGVDEDAVVDGGGGVAGEEEVVERFEEVALVGDAVPVGLFVALDEGACQLVAGEVHQFGGQAIVAVVHVAALFDQVAAHVGLVEQAGEDVLDVVDLSPTLEDAAEVVVFGVDEGFVEDVAIEGVSGVEGGHAFDFGPRSVQQHGAQPAGLGGDVHRAWGDVLFSHI